MLGFGVPKTQCVSSVPGDRLKMLSNWRTLAGRPLLPVVRLAFLCFFLAVMVFIALPEWLENPVVAHDQSWPVVFVMIAMGTAAIWIHRHDRVPLWLDPMAALGVGALVWAIGVENAAGVLFVGIMFRALYGSSQRLVLALSLTLAAIVVGFAVSGAPASSANLLENLPGLVLSAAAVHLVLVAVRRYETGANTRFEVIVRSSRSALIVCDRDTVASYVSPALEEVFGLPGSVLPEGRFLSWVLPEDRETVASLLADLASQPGETATFECRVARGAGGAANVEVVGQNLLRSPDLRGLLIAVHDVTANVQLREQFRYQAFHDPLTGVANRALFGEQLENALKASSGRVSLLLMDVDSLKAVNDTFGHPAGDGLLVEVARRLGSIFEPTDTLARIGGDEFAVVLEGCRGSMAMAQHLAQRVLGVLEEPFSVAGSTLVTSMSIGIATSLSVQNAGGIVREADAALYRAKLGGKGRYEIYSPGLGEDAAQRAKLEVELRQALTRGEFFLQYQPIYDLDTNSVAGFEALLRWRHPTRGTVMPADFIPLAESNGLIVPLGRWVLEEACRFGAVLEQAVGRPLQVNVNASARQFAHRSLFGDVSRALEHSRLDPRRLTIEITESVFANESDDIGAQLRSLKDLGVVVSLDDFGTGYSSLGALRSYAVDEVKIDRSFVERITAGESDDVRVVEAIIAMSNALRLRTVAEGIETEAQLTRLTKLGCDFGQGFGLCRPMDRDVMIRLLCSEVGRAPLEVADLGVSMGCTLGLTVPTYAANS